MKILLALLCAVLPSLCQAVGVPAGVDNSSYERLLKKYVNGQGLVAYARWKGSSEDVKALDEYLAQFGKAGGAASGSERFASLINAYNGFVLQWIIKNYPTESIWALKNSFKERRNNLGGAMVSLNDIENENLRPEFGYRTHAVLVCAARSCPPLQESAYTGAGLDDQVARAYRTWLGRVDMNEFSPKTNEAAISSIFKWFKGDFEKAGGVQKVIAKYAPPAGRELMQKEGTKITYKDYNWGLNDQGEHGRHYSRTNLYLDNIFK